MGIERPTSNRTRARRHAAVSVVGAFSLLISSAVIVLWVRSYGQADRIAYLRLRGDWSVLSEAEHVPHIFPGEKTTIIDPPSDIVVQWHHRTGSRGGSLYAGYIRTERGQLAMSFLSRRVAPLDSVSTDDPVGWTVGVPVYRWFEGRDAIGPNLYRLPYVPAGSDESTWGFAWRRAWYTGNQAGNPADHNPELVLPHWFVLALILLPPALWFRRFWRNRLRARRGLCLTCGYDLRATRQRCPECGTVVNATPAAPSDKS
jgi:hypothetical protein